MVEDLKHAPLVAYGELARICHATEEALEFASSKNDRASTFIAGLGDYISGYPEIDLERRAFILRAIADYFENEMKIIRERVVAARHG